MASKLERKVPQLAFNGDLEPKDMEDLDDLSFAAVKELKFCRNELRDLGEKLEEAMATAKPEPGRASAERVDEVRRLRASPRNDKLPVTMQSKYLEVDVLAYELTLKAQETALARALKAEENGTVPDPLRVFIVENTVKNIKNHVRYKAARDTIFELKEAML